jgi:hypothetical protein
MRAPKGSRCGRGATLNGAPNDPSIRQHPLAWLALSIHSPITILLSWLPTNCQDLQARGRGLRLLE